VRGAWVFDMGGVRASETTAAAAAVLRDPLLLQRLTAHLPAKPYPSEQGKLDTPRQPPSPSQEEVAKQINKIMGS